MLPLLFSTLLAVAPDTLPPDGPYLFYQGDSVVARWADTERRTTGEATFDPADLEEFPVFTAFDPSRVDIHRSFTPRREEIYPGVRTVAALSDIHGQYETARKLLEVNGIIDDQLNWTFGEGHLVIVGDIFDRGDRVTEILWLVYNLEQQAEAAGGMVHFLLGNHETMILHGDERYLNARYRTTSGLLGEFYKDLYGPDTYLGRWLRSLPLAVQINDVVYVHGGFSREMVREVGSLEGVNRLYHDYLLDAGENLSDVRSSSRRLDLLYGDNGPLWYRGYFASRDFTEDDLRFVLRRLDAERIVVGHTSFTSVQGFFHNRVIAVDSSIKFGSVGEILIVRDGAYFRGTITGKEIPLEDTTK